MKKHVIYPIALATGICVGATAQAAEFWELNVAGLSCEVSLQGMKSGSGRGRVQVGDLCDDQLSDLSGWSYGDSGDQIIFKVGGAEVAYVNWRSNSFWEGWLIDDDGIGVSMSYIGELHGNGGAGAGAGGYSGGNSGGGDVSSSCKAYHDNGDCAESSDIGKVTEGALENLANLNIRFLASRTSSKLGTLPAGSCVAVRSCMEMLIDKEIWCQIELNNNQSGWVLKESADTVYALNGCN